MQILKQLYCRIMSIANKKTKTTLSNKLTKKNTVVKPKAIIVNQETKLWDIEDLPGGGAAASSRYFSPVQTRKQRQIKSLVKSNIPAKKAREDGDSKDANIKNIQEKRLSKEIKAEVKLENEIKPDLQSVKPEIDTPNEKWWQQLDNIRLMRSEKPAPVDTQGCHMCADINADAKTQRFHKLVALMLSSQTKDETTFEAMNRLKNRTLTPASIQSIQTSELETLLHPVSFYKNKAKYLKQTAQILIDKYDQDIPDNIKDLLKLPGVGPKMGHICMATAWNKVTGIGVDTHVHRIANRLSWLRKPTKEPEQTRIQLESWIPHELWAEVNHLFVGFGQTICTPVRPNCCECLNKNICAASTAAKKLK